MRAKLFLIGLSIVFSLSIAEFVVRTCNIGFNRGILIEGGNLLDYNFRGLYSYDPILGWAPSAHVSQDRWGVKVNILDDGIRSNGRVPLSDGLSPVLAVGDSFTFGDEVRDSQTWPALLEAFSGRRVINAGVSSYGLDQIVLRAEVLVDKYKPDTLIIGFIYEDLVRCAEYIRHGVPKPHFVVKDGALLLKSPPAEFKPKPRLDWFKKIFGHSQLCSFLMDRYAHRYWWENTNLDIRFEQVDVIEIAKLLLKRIDAMAQQRNIKVILLAQAGSNAEEKHAKAFKVIKAYALSQCPRVRIVDALSLLLRVKGADPAAFDRLFIKNYFNHHMTPQGNALIARLLLPEIKP